MVSIKMMGLTIDKSMLDVVPTFLAGAYMEALKEFNPVLESLDRNNNELSVQFIKDKICYHLVIRHAITVMYYMILSPGSKDCSRAYQAIFYHEESNVSDILKHLDQVKKCPEIN